MPLRPGMRSPPIPRLYHLAARRHALLSLSLQRPLLAQSILKRWASSSQSQSPTAETPAPATPEEEQSTYFRDEPVPGRALPKLPFRFETGVALFAKRTPRPFPPPFTSAPSVSFSDALSTFDRSRDLRRGQFVNGELIRGLTNGDDAVYASDYFVCVNDGVGAWSTRPRGHAGLWSRLILHFWTAAMEEDMCKPRAPGEEYRPDPVAYLDSAYEQVLSATSLPNCQGTTTVCGAQLHYKTTTPDDPDGVAPLLYVTNLGDSQVLVLRPSDGTVVYKTTEQWHWFDCPRQLGTNSNDTPRANASVDEVDMRAGDVVLAMSDGVIDNLWEHEIVRIVRESMGRWEETRGDPAAADVGKMQFAASELLGAAKAIALDPFAECPYMERAIEEGLASAGGKPDDISVVAACCMRNE